MSHDPSDERWLASFDPVDVAEVRAILAEDDLPGRIMALPAEPTGPTIVARIRRAIDGLWPQRLTVPSPGVGRAAFAMTVIALVGAAATLLTLSPDLGGEQEAVPTGGDEAPLTASTATVLTASVPADGPARAEVDDQGDPSTDDETRIAAEDASPSVGSTETTVDPILGQATSSSALGSPTSLSTDPPSMTTSTTQGPVDRPTTSAVWPRRSTASTVADPGTTQRTTTTRQATTTTSPPPVPSTATPPTTAAQPDPDNRVFDPSRDLVALHYDHANYRDDGQATVAGKEIVHDLDLDAIVLGGTYGASNRNYIAESELVMDTTWGPNGWVNAHANRAGAVTTAAQRWTSALERGGDVWIAEGGQSDVTADVVRAVADAMPGIDLRARIHLVQHSTVNERHTSDGDLSYLKETVDYIKIDDGNYTNDTAKLRHQDDDFVQAARSGRFANAWDAAFNYLDPDEALDFSDTVELLHIVGIGRDTIADPQDFADYFID